MRKAVQHLADQLAGIRPGTLSVGFLETFRVPIQSNTVSVSKLGAIASQGDRLILTPFDPAHVHTIVKALTEGKLNAYALDRTRVAVSVPPVSGEQKADLIKHVKKLGEEAKVAVRSVRQAARKAIAASGRGSERVVQDVTDAAIEEIERLVKQKCNGLAK